MKPVVLLAQAKELQGYIKKAESVDKDVLLEINRKLLKMQLEVSENLEKLA